MAMRAQQAEHEVASSIGAVSSLCTHLCWQRIQSPVPGSLVFTDLAVNGLAVVDCDRNAPYSVQSRTEWARAEEIDRGPTNRTPRAPHVPHTGSHTFLIPISLPAANLLLRSRSIPACRRCPVSISTTLLPWRELVGGARDASSSPSITLHRLDRA